MTTEAFHPDHLKRGDMVGPWRIVESLGSGNFGHAFKAERDGAFFTLKMAVRPGRESAPEPGEEARKDGEVDSRMRHEGAILLANASQPGLLHLRAVDRWPHPIHGYLYIVTDHVPGDPFHVWREHARPFAAQLVDVFTEVVRVVAGLHGHGILIRDFKSEHVIIDPTDNRPVLVDLGSAWLPGGSTLTVGLAPGTPHALPPECIAFIREGAWKQGARFDPSASGDLYQLGVFFYEALTDCWPFDGRMTQEELLVAIETVVPRAPHRLNPAVPESLSRITLKLLEKRPEDRYESAETLLRALWDAAKERSKPSWKVPLELPPEGAAPITQEEVEERRLQQQEAARKAKEARERGMEELSREEALEQLSLLTQGIQEQLDLADAQDARRKKRWRSAALMGSALLLLLVLFAAWRVWFTPTPPSPSSEKGSSLVSTFSNSRPVRTVAAWLCTTLGIGCTTAPVRPLPEDCPSEVVRAMRELNLHEGDAFDVIVDINQPGDAAAKGVYHEGRIVSRIIRGREGALPVDTLLYGQLWTEKLFKRGQEAVLGRYTEALLPNGRRVPVCMIMGPDASGLTPKEPDSKPGEAHLYRTNWAAVAEVWP